jgi:hypothetical protein
VVGISHPRASKTRPRGLKYPLGFMDPFQFRNIAS